ncbi:probable E3 ubiquitin-protein ligase HECTD2 isoform X2 [Dysidea avara]|uniref:probable E3 ubiquitin-protein ligase HECTD2 isoform X2 n=1 Tax=Dysidea avara TaxID=196820 RepID=UPI0033199E72
MIEFVIVFSCTNCGVRYAVKQQSSRKKDQAQKCGNDQGKTTRKHRNKDDCLLRLPSIKSSSPSSRGSSGRERSSSGSSSSRFRRLCNLTSFLSSPGRSRHSSQSGHSSASSCSGENGDFPATTSGRRGSTASTSSEDSDGGIQQPCLTSAAVLRQDFQQAKKERDYSYLQTMLVSTFKSSRDINLTFKLSAIDQISPHPSELDWNFIYLAYEIIMELPSSAKKATLRSIIQCLLKSSHKQPPKDHLRTLMVLLENPQFGNIDTYVILAHLLRQVSLLSDQDQQCIVHWFCRYKPARFGDLVSKILQFISVRLFPPNPSELPPPMKCTWWIPSATKVLALLNAANSLHHPPLISYTEFYNTALDHTDLMAEYYAWQSPQGHATMRFSFCQYPFILSMNAKKMILQRDSEHQMLIMAKRSLVEKVHHEQMPHMDNLFLNLQVRRSHLVEDSLNELLAKQGDLKKKVRVTFAGEPGLDMGGLTKEWFLLLVREIFHPDYGMFISPEKSQLHWFNAASIDTDSEFHLIGMLMGLAVYNGTILDIHLPSFCYKKLLSPSSMPTDHHTSVGIAPLSVHNLAEIMPTMAKSLKELLTYQGNVQEDFCYTFQASYEAYGELVTKELKPGGKDVIVTNENRTEFVNLYVDYLLNMSVYKQFSSFYYGFHSVCASNALTMFRAEEIEMLVCGCPYLDILALEEVTVYEGYCKSDSTIKHFWEVVQSLSLTQQKLLLLFTTGSDRIPIGGVAEMHFKISRLSLAHPHKTDILPMAHTCFNNLLLPPYKSRKRLKEKLLIAINNAEGFGLK